MEQPITNPPIPYTGAIHGGFAPGKMVRIQGYVSPVGQRFNINFQTGPNSQPRDDVALHISVRLSEGYIARNSLQQGIWGEEQGSGNLPIGTGEKFEIIVLAEQRQYKVAVNGKHFTEFPHRIPLERVNHLLIDGDLSLSLISWEGGIESSAPSAPLEGPPQYSGRPQNVPYGPPPGHYGETGPQYGPGPGPYGPYGPPPPGGPYGGSNYPHPPPGYKEPSEYDNILETAQSAIAGAISSGAAEKLLGGLFGGGGHAQNTPSHPNPQPQHPPAPPPQQQHNSPFDLSHLGGSGSLGGLGSVGSLLQSFAGQVFAGQQNKEGGQQQHK